VKTILRTFFLLLIALFLARILLPGEHAGWEQTYPVVHLRLQKEDVGVRWTETRENVMGTRFSLEIAAPDPDAAESARHAAWRRIHGLEASLSTWIRGSTLSRVNREAAAAAVPVNDDVLRVLLRSREAWRLSDGAFDPTVGPLLAVWKPLAKLSRLPDAGAVERARGLVGFDRVAIDEKARTVRFGRPGISLDVGGIGKGYAADEAARAALAAGATACRVNAGGDMAARGAPPWSPAGFAVEVRDPDGRADQAYRGIEFPLRDRAVATSGNYERYTEIAGKRYSHILDPRTGRPVPDAVVQVTVVAPDGALADALATALTVLGAERGVALANRLDDVEALFILARGPEDVRRPDVATAGFPGYRR